MAYKKNLKGRQRQDQYSLAPGQAQVEGMAKVARAQEQLGNEYKEFAGSAQQETLAKLRDFEEYTANASKNAIDATQTRASIENAKSKASIAKSQANAQMYKATGEAVGMLTGIAAEGLKNKAQKDVTADIAAINEKRYQIQTGEVKNPDGSAMSDEDIRKALDDLTLKTKEGWFGVYSKVYNNAITADYVNSSTVRADELILKAQDLAQGDPTKFKEIWKQYMADMPKGAPTDSSRVAVQGMLYEKGMSAFRNINKAKDAEIKKEQNFNSNEALKIASNKLFAAVSRGQDGMMDRAQSATQLDAILVQRYKQGFITESEMKATRAEIDRRVQQGEITAGFTDVAKMGTAEMIEYKKAVTAAYQAGSFDTWKPGTFSKMMSSFDATVKARQKVILDGASAKIARGETLDPKEKKEFMDALQNQPPGVKRDKTIGLLATEQIKEMDLVAQDDPQHLSKRLDEITMAMDKAEGDEKFLLKKMKEQTEKDIALSKSNNMELAKQKGLIDITPINPASSPDEITARSNQSHMAQNRYGGPLKVFTKEEEAQFKEFFSDPGIPAAEKLQTAINIQNAYGKDAYKAFENIGKGSPVIQGALFVALRPTDNPSVKQANYARSKKIMEGQGYIDSGAVTVKNEDIQDAITNSYGNVFLGMPADQQKAMIASTKAYIAYKMAYEGTKEGTTPKKGIVFDSTSTDPSDFIKELYGPVAEHNGYNFFVSPGVDPDEVIDRLDMIDEETDIRPMKGVPEGQEWQVIEDGRIYYTPQGYGVITKNGQKVVTPSGEPFLLDLGV